GLPSPRPSSSSDARYLMCSRKLCGSMCRGSAYRRRAKAVANTEIKTPALAGANLDSFIAKHLLNNHAIPARERRLVRTLEPGGSNHHRPRTHWRFRPVIAIERYERAEHPAGPERNCLTE